VEIDRLQVGTQCREGGEHRSDEHHFRRFVLGEGDTDGGGSGGKERGDEWNELPNGMAQLERFQIRKQWFVDGAKLQNRENFRGQDVWIARFSEHSHPSGVLPETSPFERRWESFERLSIQVVEEKEIVGCWHTHSTSHHSRHLPAKT
jgi:hypothetical protein